MILKLPPLFPISFIDSVIGQGEDVFLHHGHRHRHDQRQGLPHQLLKPGGDPQEHQGRRVEVWRINLKFAQTLKL